VEEAAQQSHRAAELDPLALIIVVNHAWICYVARDYDGSIQAAKSGIEINDAWPNAYLYLSLAYAQKGMYDDATRAASKAAELGGLLVSAHLANLASMHALAGRKAEAEQLLQRAKTNPWEGFYVARAYVALGKPDSAFAWLERSSWRWPHRAVLADPALDPLRADPRFAELSAKVAKAMGIQ
jgi:tetratricopeptide (TPR) repeat protein